MKKRIYSIALIAMMLLGILAGCGNTKDVGNTQKETEVESSEAVVETTETVEEKTLEADGISITGLMGKAETIDIVTVTDGDEYTSVSDYVATLTDKNATALAVYDINLLDAAASNVQPDGSVEITLTIPDDLVNAEGDGYEIYRKETNGAFTKLDASVSDDKITFSTEHFSIYAIVKTNSETIPETVEATEIAEPESSEVVEETTPQYTYTDISATKYAQQTVNVRDLPTTDGNRLGSLSTNQEVSVTGQCNETGWYRIVYGDGEAFVSNKYLGDSKVEVKQPTQNTNNSSSGSTELQNFPYPLYEPVYNGDGTASYYGIRFDSDNINRAFKEACNLVGQNYYAITLETYAENGWSYTMYVKYMGTYAEGEISKISACIWSDPEARYITGGY